MKSAAVVFILCCIQLLVLGDGTPAVRFDRLLSGDFTQLNENVLKDFEVRIDTSGFSEQSSGSSSARFTGDLVCTGFAVGDIGVTGTMNDTFTGYSVDMFLNDLVFNCEAPMCVKYLFSNDCNSKLFVESTSMSIRPSVVVESADFRSSGPIDSYDNPAKTCDDIVDTSGLKFSVTTTLDVIFPGITNFIIGAFAGDVTTEFKTTICEAVANATATLNDMIKNNTLVMEASSESIEAQAIAAELTHVPPAGVEMVNWTSVNEFLDEARQFVDLYNRLRVEFQNSTIDEVLTFLNLTVGENATLADYLEAADVPVPEWLNVSTIDLELWVNATSDPANANATVVVNSFYDAINFDLLFASEDPLITDIILRLGLNQTVTENSREDAILLLETLQGFLPTNSTGGNGTSAELEIDVLIDFLNNTLPPEADPFLIAFEEFYQVLSNNTSNSTVDVVAILDVYGLNNLTIPLGNNTLQLQLVSVNVTTGANNTDLLNFTLVGEDTLLFPKLDLGDIVVSMDISVQATLLDLLLIDPENPVTLSFDEIVRLEFNWLDFFMQMAGVFGLHRGQLDKLDINNPNGLAECTLAAVYANITAAVVNAEQVTFTIGEMEDGILNLFASGFNVFYTIYQSSIPDMVEAVTSDALTSFETNPDGTCVQPVTETPPVDNGDDTNDGSASSGGLETSVIAGIAAGGAALVLGLAMTALYKFGVVGGAAAAAPPVASPVSEKEALAVPGAVPVQATPVPGSVDSIL